MLLTTFIKNKYLLLFIIMILCLCDTRNNVYSKSTNETYCRVNKLGWYFYCDKPKNIKNNPVVNGKSNNSSQSYTKQLEFLQKQLNESKAKAVLNPTEQNIKEYLFLQMIMLNQASLFSDVWRRTLWKTPQLDYLQRRPINSQSKTLFDTNRHHLEEANFRNINKEFGIFFIYSTTCPYCTRYGELLYNIKQEFNISIIGITLDGKFLPNWEHNSKIYNNELARLNIPINSIPITLLYNNKLKQITVVGYGLLTRDELISRIYLLTNKQVGEDY